MRLPCFMRWCKTMERNIGPLLCTCRASRRRCRSMRSSSSGSASGTTLPEESRNVSNCGAPALELFGTSVGGAQAVLSWMSLSSSCRLSSLLSSEKIPSDRMLGWTASVAWNLSTSDGDTCRCFRLILIFRGEVETEDLNGRHLEGWRYPLDPSVSHWEQGHPQDFSETPSVSIVK